MKSQLKMYRSQLDEMDRRLLVLLSRRFLICAKIGQLKKVSKLPIVDWAREREVINDRCQLAASFGIHPAWTSKLFRLIISYSRQVQKT